MQPPFSFQVSIFWSIQEFENIGCSRQQGAKPPVHIQGYKKPPVIGKVVELSKRWLYIWYRISEGELEKGVEAVETGKWRKLDW